MRNITARVNIRSSNLKEYDTIQSTQGAFYDEDTISGGDGYRQISSGYIPWHQLFLDASTDKSNYGNPAAGHTSDNIHPFTILSMPIYIY